MYCYKGAGVIAESHLTMQSIEEKCKNLYISALTSFDLKKISTTLTQTRYIQKYKMAWE